MSRSIYLALAGILLVLGSILLGLGVWNLLGQGGPQTEAVIVTLKQEPPRPASYDLPVGTGYYDPGPAAVEQTPPPPSNAPSVRMVIERIGVDAPVVTMGVQPDGVPEVPQNGEDVAWYDFSAKPGQGSNAVFAGHYTWGGGPAVFWNLDELQEGDIIRVVFLDGRELVYRVFANFTVDPDDPDSLQVMAPSESDIITLITCGGTWVPDRSEPLGGSYSERTIVQAELVQ